MKRAQMQHESTHMVCIAVPAFELRTGGHGQVGTGALYSGRRDLVDRWCASRQLPVALPCGRYVNTSLRSMAAQDTHFGFFVQSLCANAPDESHLRLGVEDMVLFDRPQVPGGDALANSIIQHTRWHIYNHISRKGTST